MREYLFTEIQRMSIALLAILYAAYTLYTASSFELQPDQFFKPYSKIAFVIALAACLAFVQRQNWKQQIRILTLAAVLIFIFFNTSLQLSNFFEVGTQITDLDNAKNTAGQLQFDNIDKLSSWIASRIQFESSYRLGKILLLDIFAIFAFIAINRTIDKIKFEE